MKRPACFVSLCLLLFLFLIMHTRPPDVYDHSSLSGKTVKAQGTLTDKYQKNGSFCLILSGVLIERKEKSQKEKYDIIVKLAEDALRWEDLPAVGKTVLVRGRVYLFDTARNPGQFDMASYEKGRGIDLMLTSASILGISGKEDCLREGMNRFRHRVSLVYDGLFGAEYSGIIKAMTLGDRNALDPQIKASYMRAGIAHVLCISGVHISILGCFIYRSLKRLRLPREPSAAISLAFLILYAMMTGMGIGVKRAVIMFFLMLLADCIGRSYDLLSALAVSGCVILLNDPGSLNDAGFVLSFGAVTGIGLLKPSLDRLIPAKNAAADPLKISAAATVFTFPMVLYFYFQIPVYAVFLNLLIVPLMGILLILAFLAGFSGLVFMPAARVPAKICILILRIYEGVCDLNDKLPYCVLIKGRPNIVYIIIFYLMLILSVLIIERYLEKPEKLTITAFRILGCLAVFLAILVTPVNISRKTRITMLDIGQGDCTCIETKKGRVIMIDCGSSDESDIARYRVIPFLKCSGRSCIDTMVMTHADNDHISGMKELFSLPEKESLPVKDLVMPDVAMKDEAFCNLMELARKRGAKVTLISTGDSFSMDGITLTCLHPDRGYECIDRNESSAVLSMQYKGFRALFTGDVEGRGEEILTERITGSYALLKCAHHGSDNSTFEGFLKKAAPDVAF
ncbi:MAG: DNA internalization-related competence protein ComEC/Rec2, partial [Lachnospiraceae bacterium]|nr:DNA internalization-related competence protein ComEC/Rec2 [Lachnospiraceae bacterium]